MPDSLVARQRDHGAFGATNDCAHDMTMGGGLTTSGPNEVLQGWQMGVEFVQALLQLDDVIFLPRGVTWRQK